MKFEYRSSRTSQTNVIGYTSVIIHSTILSTNSACTCISIHVPNQEKQCVRKQIGRFFIKFVQLIFLFDDNDLFYFFICIMNTFDRVWNLFQGIQICCMNDFWTEANPFNCKYKITIYLYNISLLK